MDRLVGIPYVQHGRNYDGADCWGIVYLFYRDVLGRPVPSYIAEMEGREFRPRSIAPLVDEQRTRDWIEVSAPLQGDVVLMRDGIHHNHVGVYLDGHRTLHSNGPGFSSIERLDSLRLKNRVVGFYRLLEC